ncbi:hypothetical protein Dimus_032636 [Dionaea muscipula]
MAAIGSLVMEIFLYYFHCFLNSTGIKKHKKDKIVYDKQTTKSKRHYGHDRVNDNTDIPIIEVKMTDGNLSLYLVSLYLQQTFELGDYKARFANPLMLHIQKIGLALQCSSCLTF